MTTTEIERILALAEKAEDLRAKIGQYSADLSFETPLYPDTKATVDGWLQSHHDITKEIMRLRIAIQRTNLATLVPIDLDGISVTKSIAEWIHRRRDLAKLEESAWAKLTDRNLKEGQANNSTGQPVTITIRRYYDPKKRDAMVSSFKSEPHKIDATLEVTNAVTDLIES